MSRLLAITMGDPAGVGPEVIVGSWEAPALQAACRRVVVGRTAVIQRAVSLLGRSLSVERVTSLGRISADPLLIPVWECGDEAADQVQAGEISSAAGSASRDAL
ncbi:MAG: 4-hydroxythreonine-4-phosphate dehydrogenase PdxA, partial [Planctomycetota bacterium]